MPNKPEMTAALAEAYTVAGNDNDALVIPAGLAFARVVKEQPKINLYVADKRHPTLAGTYLAAGTTYAALFRRSPVGLKYTAGLDAGTAKVLQEAAWATVQDYFGGSHVFFAGGAPLQWRVMQRGSREEDAPLEWRAPSDDPRYLAGALAGLNFWTRFALSTSPV